MSVRLWQRLRTFSKGLAVLVVLLATAEATTRADDWLTWQAPVTGPYSHGRLMTHDSLGVRGRPEYRFEKWRMNNEGFRGADLRLMTDPGVTRVAVLGASETFGLYESEGFEYPARMGAWLDSLAPGRFEVVNAGLPGMSISAMVPYYERAVARIRPHYVMIYPSPTFYLGVEPLKAVHIEPSGPLEVRPRRPRFPFDSRLARKSRDVLKELVPPVLVTEYRKWHLTRIRARHAPDWVWDSVPEERMAILEQHLKQLVTTIRTSGAQPVLLTHTNRFIGAASIGSGERRHLINLMSAYHPRASLRVMVAVDSAANRIIRRIAREERAYLVEVEGRIPPSGRNFADYAHFTDEGADAMARLLANGLLDLKSERTQAIVRLQR